MYSEKKKAKAIIYLQEIFKNEEYLNALKKNKLLLENDYLKNEDLKNWNESNSSFNFLDKADIWNNYDKQDVMFFLRHIGIMLRLKNSDINKWSTEYNFFKEKFSKELKTQAYEYRKQLNVKNNKFNEQSESQRMSDIGSGIFSPQSAEGRSVYFSLAGPNYSEEFLKINSELNYILKQGVSFIYLKLEEICFIAYSLTDTRAEEERLYLKKKFDSFKKIKEFKEKITEKDVSTMNEILKFANHYKHQTKISSLNQESVDEFFSLLDHLFNLLSGLFVELKSFYQKAIDVYEEYDDWTNPLGLTGFEMD